MRTMMIKIELDVSDIESENPTSEDQDEAE